MRLWGRFVISVACCVAGIYGHGYVYGVRAATLEAHSIAGQSGAAEVMRGIKGLLPSMGVEMASVVMAVGGLVAAIEFGLQLGSGGGKT